MPQSCSECFSSIGFLRRKSKCVVCRNTFCESCFSKTKRVTRSNVESIDLQRNCLRCVVLNGQSFHREDLSLLNVKHLREFLISRSISTKDCTEKYHLVDLIMKFAEDCGQRSVTDLRLEEERQREVENMRMEAERRENEERLRAASQSVDELNVNSDLETEFLNARSQKKWKSVEELSSIEEIQQLTITELKRILTVNFVDYRGCVEKVELVERVKRLWESQKAENNQGKDSKDEWSSYDRDLCKICMDAPIDCVLLDCGHLITCVKCGKRLAECPICRQLVSKVVHVFRA